MAVIEDTLMDHEFLPLPQDGHALFHQGVVTQRLFEILYFMEGNPLHHNFEYGIFFLHSYMVHYMQVCVPVSSLCLDCSFFNLPMCPFISLGHHQVMTSALPEVPMVTLSRMDFTDSAFSIDATWLRASATALSLPF